MKLPIRPIDNLILASLSRGTFWYKMLTLAVGASTATNGLNDQTRKLSEPDGKYLYTPAISCATKPQVGSQRFLLFTRLRRLTINALVTKTSVSQSSSDESFDRLEQFSRKAMRIPCSSTGG